MDTMEKWQVELENTCTCSDEDGNYLEDCYGCFEDSLAMVDEMVTQWVNSIEFEGSAVRVDGTGMGWQRLSGYAETTIDDIPKSLYLNGEFRIVFTLDGNELSAVRYSHDEPTGTGKIIFTPLLEEEQVA